MNAVLASRNTARTRPSAKPIMASSSMNVISMSSCENSGCLHARHGSIHLPLVQALSGLSGIHLTFSFTHNSCQDERKYNRLS